VQEDFGELNDEIILAIFQKVRYIFPSAQTARTLIYEPQLCQAVSFAVAADE
jgi:hypothetical protein